MRKAYVNRLGDPTGSKLPADMKKAAGKTVKILLPIAPYFLAAVAIGAAFRSLKGMF
jgi:hypothetical protein